MQPEKAPKRTSWKASSRLAFASAALAVLFAAGFAILLPSKIATGELDSIRWFAVSAFPLAIVLWIVVFTRLQKQIDQKADSPVNSNSTRLLRSL